MSVVRSSVGGKRGGVVAPTALATNMDTSDEGEREILSFVLSLKMERRIRALQHPDRYDDDVEDERDEEEHDEQEPKDDDERYGGGKFGHDDDEFNEACEDEEPDWRRGHKLGGRRVRRGTTAVTTGRGATTRRNRANESSSSGLKFQVDRLFLLVFGKFCFTDVFACEHFRNEENKIHLGKHLHRLEDKLELHRIDRSRWFERNRKSLWPRVVFVLWLMSCCHALYYMSHQYHYDYYRFRLKRVQWLNRTHPGLAESLKAVAMAAETNKAYNQSHQQLPLQSAYRSLLHTPFGLETEDYLREKIQVAHDALLRVGSPQRHLSYLSQCMYLLVLLVTLLAYYVAPIYTRYLRPFNIYLVRNFFDRSSEQRICRQIIAQQAVRFTESARNYTQALVEFSERNLGKRLFYERQEANSTGPAGATKALEASALTGAVKEMGTGGGVVMVPLMAPGGVAEDRDGSTQKGLVNAIGPAKGRPSKPLIGQYHSGETIMANSESLSCRQLRALLATDQLMPINQSREWIQGQRGLFAYWTIFCFFYCAFIDTSSATILYSLSDSNVASWRDALLGVEFIFLMTICEITTVFYSSVIVFTCHDQIKLANRLRKLVKHIVALNTVRFYGNLRPAYRREQRLVTASARTSSLTSRGVALPEKPRRSSLTPTKWRLRLSTGGPEQLLRPNQQLAMTTTTTTTTTLGASPLRPPALAAKSRSPSRRRKSVLGGYELMLQMHEHFSMSGGPALPPVESPPCEPDQQAARNSTRPAGKQVLADRLRPPPLPLRTSNAHKLEHEDWLDEMIALNSSSASSVRSSTSTSTTTMTSPSTRGGPSMVDLEGPERVFTYRRPLLLDLEELENKMNQDFLLIIMHYRVFFVRLTSLIKLFGSFAMVTTVIMFLVPFIGRLHQPYFLEMPMRHAIVVFSCILLVPVNLTLIGPAYMHRRCLDLYGSLNSLLAHATEIINQNEGRDIYDRHLLSILRKELSMHEGITANFATKFAGISFTYPNLVRLHFYFGFLVLSIIAENQASESEIAGSLFTDPFGLF